MNENLLREWIRQQLLTEAQLHEGQVLGFIAEWSVYAVVSNDMPLQEIAQKAEEISTSNSVWKLCIQDGRVVKPYKEALGRDQAEAQKKDEAAGNTESIDALKDYINNHDGRSPRQQAAYEAYTEMAYVFRDAVGGETFGGPEGNTTPSNQPSTAAIDVPCVSADIHVKYNDKSRLESFRRTSISRSSDSGLSPGSPSTKIYDAVIKSIVQPEGRPAGTNIAMDYPEYKWMTEELNPPLKPEDLFVGETKIVKNKRTGKAQKERTGALGSSLKRPGELSGLKSLWKTRRPELIKAAIESGVPSPEWDRAPRKNYLPLGLIPASNVGVKASAKLKEQGVTSYQGLRGEVLTYESQVSNDGVWWNIKTETGPEPLTEGELLSLARYDDVDMAYQSWTTSRADLLKGSGFGDFGGRDELYDMLRSDYLPQLKKDLFAQHFRGVDSAVAEDIGNEAEATIAASLDAKTAYYAKFKGNPGSYSVDVLRYPKVPSPDDIEIRENQGATDTLYTVHAPVLTGEFGFVLEMGEMLKLQYSFSGQNKPPTLNTGKDYQKFVETYWVPSDLDAAMRVALRSPVTTAALQGLMASYVREILTLLRS